MCVPSCMYRVPALQIMVRQVLLGSPDSPWSAIHKASVVSVQAESSSEQHGTIASSAKFKSLHSVPGSIVARHWAGVRSSMRLLGSAQSVNTNQRTAWRSWVSTKVLPSDCPARLLVAPAKQTRPRIGPRENRAGKSKANSCSKLQQVSDVMINFTSLHLTSDNSNEL